MTNVSTPEFSVLITDDLPQNRSYFADLLRKIAPQIVVYEAESGEEALIKFEEIINHTGIVPQLVIMDYRMPGLNGAATTHAIRQIEQKRFGFSQSIIFTWSSSLFSAYPEADDWLPKYTDTSEVKAKLILHGLLQGN